jgi:alpha-D-xyloside xylohydrolase
MFGPSLLVSPITKPMYHKADNLHELIPYDAFQLPGQNKPGIEMDFYKGTEMEEKAIGRKTEQVKLGWFGSIPLELQDTSYSVKWQSKLEIRTDGIYEFMIQTNGGVKLTINNTTLIDEWDNGEDAIFKGEINLKAGKRYDFRIVHNQPRNNQARFHLKWLPPGKKGIYDKEEEVYLPAGTSWYDFWTGKQFEGGQIIQRTAPINIMPLYVKAGSILPMGPNIQYAEEKPPNPLEIRVYTGAAGSFVLYEDENDGYGYEKGEYTEIPIKWDENAGELNIGKRRGSYPGMLKKRTFKIVWVDTEKGTGGAIETNPDRIVEYSGDPLTVKK